MIDADVGRRALGTVFAIVVAALILGQVLGQPILLGYVASGSMEPAMDTGDGFVAVPAGLGGEVSDGDVIVYEAREVNDGELTTHRVIEETDEGYVTKGDANPFTDQDGGEPYVTDGQVVATALQVHGTVVTIPHLGTVVMGVRSVLLGVLGAVAGALGLESGQGGVDADGAGALLVGLGVGLLGFGVVFDRAEPPKRDRFRQTTRRNVIAIWSVVGIVLLVLATAATAAMVVPSGTTAYEVVSTDDPSDEPQVMEPGASADLTRTVDNAGYAPIVVVTEPASDGVTAEPDRQVVGGRSDGETTITLSAPERQGTSLRTVSEYRYLLVLPPVLLGWLHGVHPYLAVTAVDAVVVGVGVLAILALFGTGDIRVRNPGSHVPFSRRIRRKLEKWLD
ncbi:signal peptidase I [Halovivax cerinus]|uniref:Signal peptidase I n=1 Tax=Halovivax cerinus TaxID=1487865 RepID=A0ABD5NKQ4_9EURY|nr:signal peptidase I [Halovivax cerinus]